MTVRTGFLCGYELTPGVQYVVYAHESQDWLRVDFCTRTMPAVSAAENLAFLDALPRLPLSRAWPSPPSLFRPPGPRGTCGAGLEACNRTDPRAQPPT